AVGGVSCEQDGLARLEGGGMRGGVVHRRAGKYAAGIIGVMTASNEWLKVESLDLEGQGVAHDAEGRVVFIEGALAGEEVQVEVHRRKNNWEQAAMTVLRRESSQRVTPRCKHFGV